jgi:CheY-like chemotaxis protein
MNARPLHRILHVEDEPDIRTIAKMALEALGGFEVQSCVSGEEAVAKGPAFKPDLVLLDVMMPGIDGPTTFGELRKIEALRTTPVVFMTAKAQAHEIERLKSLGAVDVVVKPFDPEQLCQQLNAIWQRVGV